MKATKPATLGTLEFDAIISRTESMESEIPSYATEDGYSASDNICLKPVTLSAFKCTCDVGERAYTLCQPCRNGLRRIQEALDVSGYCDIHGGR